MPKTKGFLESVLESVEEYQVRRVRTMLQEKKKSGETIRLWQLQREAGLRKEAFEMVKKKLGL